MEESLKKYYFILVVAVILGCSLILSSMIATNGFVKVKAKENTITVTGSAKKQIVSDQIVWSGTFSSTASDLSTAYTMLDASNDKVKKYLVSKGIKEKEIVFSSINTNPIYLILPNGSYSNQIDSYQLTQSVEIRSKEVDKITELSRQATELINEGVEFQSNSPEYFYTKIADLKVTMMGEATKDARNRADQIAESAGNKVGNLRYAKMGVIQITPLYSTEISDYGINDTMSLEKEITAVITCKFEIK